MRRASVFVDASGSMAGYLQGATADERPFQDLIGTLPETLSRRDVAVTFHSFGTRVRDVAANDRARLLDIGYYRCSGRDAACDNQETRLDVVLRAVAAQQDGLAIIISDLWFTNTDVQTSGVAALGAPISDILASGRAVSVYGISAPYSGPVLDLPGGGAFNGARRRPLFLIVVGEDHDVGEVHEQLSRSPSAFLARGINGGAIKRSVFTLDPLREGEVQQAPLQGGRDPRVSPSQVLPAMPGLRIQQFATGRRRAQQRLQQEPAPYSWTGPRQGALLTNAVWSGAMASRIRVWQRRREGCAAANWFQMQPIEGNWVPTEGGARLRFELRPDRLVPGLGGEGVYLLTGEVTRTSLQIPNPANDWMRGWGFSSGDAAAVVARNPETFPTLNLGEVARLLEIAQAEAAERRPNPIDGFTVVLKVED